MFWSGVDCASMFSRVIVWGSLLAEKVIWESSMVWSWFGDSCCLCKSLASRNPHVLCVPTSYVFLMNCLGFTACFASDFGESDGTAPARVRREWGPCIVPSINAHGGCEALIYRNATNVSPKPPFFDPDSIVAREQFQPLLAITCSALQEWQKVR